MVRAVRLAATLDSRRRASDPRRDPRKRADYVRHLSGERIAIEMTNAACRRPAVDRAAADGRHRAARGSSRRSWPPSGACRRTRSSARTSGITRSAPSMGRSWTPRASELAALLHDGKPLTMADGRFLGHESVGAELADKLLMTGAGRSRSGGGLCVLIGHRSPAISRPGRTRDPAVHRQDRPRRARGPVPPARGRSHRVGREPDAGGLTSCVRESPGARGGRGARPERTGGRWLGPDGGARHHARARAGPTARLAAGAGHRRPVGQHARRACSTSRDGDSAPSRRRDRAAPRSGTGPVVRAGR